MNACLKKAVVFFTILFVLTIAGCSNGSDPDKSVKVSRDDKGVWFIKGGEYATYFNIFDAQGYAVATDRLWQAELYRRSARGRLAEILGSTQLSTDVYLRTVGFSDEELATQFDELDAESKEVINGYVAGFNRRIDEIKENTSLLPFEFVAVGQSLGTTFIPEAWTPSDVLAWTGLMMRNFDPEGMQSRGQLDNATLLSELMVKYPEDYMTLFNDLRWVNDPEALTYIPSGTATGLAAVNGKATGNTSSPLKTTEAIKAMSIAANNITSAQKNVKSNLKRINAQVKMGSYAWVVSGEKTASGNPVIYSGPQMGFSVPSIVMEGSINAGGLNVSGMTVAGLPGIVIGRTPHHAWSMQVGHAHTVDYYIESAENVSLHRMETIKVAGEADVVLPVYRSSHGPIVNPIPYDPENYVPSAANPIVSWKYSHWGYEQFGIKAFIALARAQSMEEFGQGIDQVPVSQHFCYADRDGNIAYWMSGRDPVRSAGEWRFPQGFLPGVPAIEWETAVLKARSTDRNTEQQFYSGWNNKSSDAYDNSSNAPGYYFGPFHRAHFIHEYLSSHDDLTFEAIRDLAPNIAATDSIRFGGNPWEFVDLYFSNFVQANPTEERVAAMNKLEGWDGHFIDGNIEEWISGTIRSEAWVLTDKWIREVIRLTFEDELTTASSSYEDQDLTVLFNTILHLLKGEDSSVVAQYNWFTNLENIAGPQNAEAVVLTALDNVLDTLGASPWNVPRSIPGEREIVYSHDLIGEVHDTPFGSRSTYAHCVELGLSGPVRIESMFPLGESGNILMAEDGSPVFDTHFFSMTPEFDGFSPRVFPLFDE